MTADYIYLGTKQQLQNLPRVAMRLSRYTFLFVDRFLPYFVSHCLCFNIFCVKSFRLMEQGRQIIGKPTCIEQEGCGKVANLIILINCLLFIERPTMAVFTNKLN